MNISLGIVDFLMLALALQGFALSVLLAYTSKQNPANRYIAAFIFAVAESALLMEADYLGYIAHYPQILTFAIPLNMAFGPLIYLYCKSLITGERQSAKTIVKHFLPAVFFMKHQLIYGLYITGVLSFPLMSEWYVLPVTQKVLFAHNYLALIPAFFSLVIYFGASYQMISKQFGDGELSIHKKVNLEWVKMLIKLLGVLIAIWFAALITGFIFPKSDLEPWLHYFLFIPAIVFVYWLGMVIYKRQSLINKIGIADNVKQPVKNYFKEDEASRYYDELKRMMVADNLFMNPTLKVDMLATRLSIPEKALSQLLNQYAGKNFNDFVNEYRLTEAKKRLVDDGYSNFTIAGIALECGFNSLATFQRVFKQGTGVTPSQYQNNFSPENIAQIPI